MKKTILCLAAAFLAMTSATAQVDKRLFNHLSVALNVGSTGIGADVAVPCTRFLDIEAGFTMTPKIKYNTSFSLNRLNYKDFNGVSVVDNVLSSDLRNIPIQGKFQMINGKVLVNVYPFVKSSFHVTVGAYFGKGSIIEVYNTQYGQLGEIYNKANAAIDRYNDEYAIPNGLTPQEHIGLKLDNYLLEPDANGNAKATLKTNSFKPYVGIGFGRAVPKKARIGFKFDLGAMFWGAPDIVDHNGYSLMNSLEGSDAGGAMRIIKKIKVYPVLNFRLCGRIF